jgi:outer membrane cobalamin receptor
VLVDGERLNTARQATDRTGAEVGLVSPDALARVEIVNGAGTVLYGSDALAGTVNIITNEPSFSADTRVLCGFNGFYSTNEHGRRGTATVGATAPSYAVRLQAGIEAFDDYTAGALGVEDTRPFFASGALHRTEPTHANKGEPGNTDAAQYAIRHRPGPALARQFYRATNRLGRKSDASARQARSHLYS